MKITTRKGDTIYFDPNVASILGLQKATVLGEMFRCGSIEINGESYAVLSASELAILMPFLNERSISRWIRELKRDKWISVKKFSNEEAFSLMNRRDSGCLYCGINFSLHNHHYPVRKKSGGNNTIVFCANHHQLFHRLTDHGAYKLNISKIKGA